jgi:hypothetical protein
VIIKTSASPHSFTYDAQFHPPGRPYFDQFRIKLGSRRCQVYTFTGVPIACSDKDRRERRPLLIGSNSTACLWVANWQILA